MAESERWEAETEPNGIGRQNNRFDLLIHEGIFQRWVGHQHWFGLVPDDVPKDPVSFLLPC